MIKFTEKSNNQKITKQFATKQKKLIDLIYSQFNFFLKNKTIKRIICVSQKPNTYYVVTTDNIWSEVEITPTLTDTYQFKLDFNIKRPISSF